MNSEDSSRLKLLNNAVADLLSGKINKEFLRSFPASSHTDETGRLADNIRKLMLKFEEYNSFNAKLSRGIFDAEPPADNPIAGGLKNLHLDLQRINAQIEQIACGNYDHQTKLRGSFGESFKKLIDSISEKEKVSQSLKESETRYRSLFTKIREAFALHQMIFDEEGNPYDYRFLEVNDAFEKMTGLNRSDIIGRTVREVFPKISGKWIEIYGDVTLKGTTRQFEEYSEETRKFHNIIAFATEQDRFATLFSDITERKEMEKMLSLLANTVKSISEAVSITDMDDRIIFVNPAFEKLYGYELSEILGMHISLLHSRDAEDIQTGGINPATQNGGWEGEIWNRSKQGREFLIHLSTSIINDDAGNALALVGIASEITAKKTAELNLKQTVSLMKATLESTVDGILVVNNKGGIETYNEQFLDLWNVPREVVFNKNDRDLLNYVLKSVADPEEFLKRIEMLYRDSESKTFDIINLTDGRIFERYSQPYLVDGKAAGRVWSFRDVTDKKRDEAEIKKINEELKESNAAKDRFFSIIAHDLKSPFQALMGYSELLFHEYYTLSEKEKKYFIDNIGQMSRNIYQLLENLLEWSRMQTGKIQFYSDVFNLLHELNPTVSLLLPSAKNKNISITVDINRIIFVKTDRNILKTIIRNLISNAIKFTSPGGHIIVSAESRGGQVEVTVADNGIGINENDLKKLFQPNRKLSSKGTLNEDGTGLGLMLCRELVQLYDGKIWVESVLGKGTKFTFTIPSGL